MEINNLSRYFTGCITANLLLFSYKIKLYFDLKILFRKWNKIYTTQKEHKLYRINFLVQIIFISYEKYLYDLWGYSELQAEPGYLFISVKYGKYFSETLNRVISLSVICQDIKGCAGFPLLRSLMSYVLHLYSKFWTVELSAFLAVLSGLFYCFQLSDFFPS